jgi:hypothetical protein
MSRHEYGPEAADNPEGTPATNGSWPAEGWSMSTPQIGRTRHREQPEADAVIEQAAERGVQASGVDMERIAQFENHDPARLTADSYREYCRHARQAVDTYDNFTDRGVELTSFATLAVRTVQLEHVADDGRRTQLKVWGDGNVEVIADAVAVDPGEDSMQMPTYEYGWDSNHTYMFRTGATDDYRKPVHIAGPDEMAYISDVIRLAQPAVPTFDALYTLHDRAIAQELHETDYMPAAIDHERNLHILHRAVRQYRQSGLRQGTSEGGSWTDRRPLPAGGHIDVAVGFGREAAAALPYVAITETRPATPEELADAEQSLNVSDPAAAMTVRTLLFWEDASEAVDGAVAYYSEQLVDTAKGLDDWQREATVAQGMFVPIDDDIARVRNFLIGPLLDPPRPHQTK